MRTIIVSLLLAGACDGVDQYQHLQPLEDATTGECEDFCIDRRSTAPDDAHDDGESCDADAPVVFCTITSGCPYYCVSCDDGSSECSSCE